MTPVAFSVLLPVYSGDNLTLAYINRIALQTKWKVIRSARALLRR